MPEREAITMEPGDLFVVVSDGIFEAKSPGDELFGTERTIAAIRAHMDEGAEAIVTGLRAAVEAFTEGRPAGDDRTGVVVMRSPLDGARSPGASDDSRRTRRRSP
jgi:sigma-B regulation protein RsbU (phosphoserine phosphatase)